MNTRLLSDISVSVIVPAYNSETSLGRAIDSALAQEHPPHEVFVINDGSTDRTAEVARSYGNRIIFLEQENLGQGAARNEGLRRATGRFIAFLDADDLWHPGFLRHCVEFLLEHDEAIAVSTGIIVRLWGKPERRWPPSVTDSAPSPFTAGMLENFYDFWARYDHVRTGSNVIRREAIERAGLQRADLRISQDLEYWGYLTTWGKWGFIPEHLWVGDPTPVAASQGWMKKYSKRRSLCPSVEQWESRIVPRLTPQQWIGFQQVRGRVAANFALNKIKAGASAEAWDIVVKYGPDMPPNWSSHLMRLGIRHGKLGRLIARALIQSRERYKSMRLAMTSVTNALDV